MHTLYLLSVQKFRQREFPPLRGISYVKRTFWSHASPSSEPCTGDLPLRYPLRSFQSRGNSAAMRLNLPGRWTSRALVPRKCSGGRGRNVGRDGRTSAAAGFETRHFWASKGDDFRCSKLLRAAYAGSKRRSKLFGELQVAAKTASKLLRAVFATT